MDIGKGYGGFECGGMDGWMDRNMHRRWDGLVGLAVEDKKQIRDVDCTEFLKAIGQ